MMTRLLFIILAAALQPLGSFAQEVAPATADSARQRPMLTHEILTAAKADTTAMAADAAEYALPMSDVRYPWMLHEGLNMEVGASVTAGLGKHRRKGAGFAEHLALAYAMPFGKDKRWIGAAGLYVTRADWGSWQYTEAGIAGMLGYRVNDWCNLYAYGAFNLLPGRQHYGYSPYAGGYYGGMYGLGGGWDMYPYAPYANLRGKIGAAVEFKVGKSATIGIAVEHDFYNNNRRNALPTAPDFGHDNGRRGASGGDNRRDF